LLYTALWSGETNSFILLLRAGCPIDYRTWSLVAGFGETQRAETELVIGRIVQQLEDTPSREHEISDLTGSPGYLVEEAMLYRPLGLRVCNAKMLFDAGFRNVDQPTKSGTSLWFHATWLFEQNAERRVGKSSLIRWLIDKGARLDTLHPYYKTTPAQLLAERIAIRIILQENIVPHDHIPHSLWPIGSIHQQPKFQSMYGEVFTSNGTDDCTCACASNGCSVIGSVLRTLAQNFHTAKVSLHRMLHAILNWLGIDIYSHPGMVQPIIRSITFEELKLTHTCHDNGHLEDRRGRWAWSGHCIPKQPLFEQEVRDIQFIDQADIRLLEELLIDFDAKIREYSGSMWAFIDGYWTDRMHQVDQEKIKSRAYHAEKNRDLGVDFHVSCDSKSEPQASAVIKYGNWEWFEREIADLMETV